MSILLAPTEPPRLLTYDHSQLYQALGDFKPSISHADNPVDWLHANIEDIQAAGRRFGLSNVDLEGLQNLIYPVSSSNPIYCIGLTPSSCRNSGCIHIHYGSYRISRHPLEKMSASIEHSLAMPPFLNWLFLF